MKLELTNRQEAWIQAEITAHRFKDEAHAQAYLRGLLDDGIQHSDGYSVDDLRRLVQEGIDSGYVLDDSGNPMDGSAAMARIWQRISDRQHP